MPATPDQLHTLALEAEECLEKLSTALASVPGVDEKAVAAIGQMADAVRQIAGMLGKSGEPEPDPQTTDQAIGAHMAQRRAAQPA